MSIQLIGLLSVHLFCNAVAETSVLSVGEARLCSGNFEELKVLLNPDMTMSEFEQLSSEDRARVSVASYRYYRTWVTQNPDLFSHLREQARLNVMVAGF